MRVYVDTSVALAYVISNDPNHQRACDLISALSDSELILSELSIVEMISVLSRNINLIEVECDEFKKLGPKERAIVVITLCIKKLKAGVFSLKYEKTKLMLPNIIIEINDLFQEAFEQAFKLKLRTLDLLHVIFAKKLRADIFLTLDKNIIRRRNIIESEFGIKILPEKL